MTAQFLTVGLVPSLRIPPPMVELAPNTDGSPVPPVIVKPSTTVSDPSPLMHLTTLSFRPVPSMVVTAAPPELRRVIALPRKLMTSLYAPGSTTTSSTPHTAAPLAA